jgi:hypothetical protein
MITYKDCSYFLKEHNGITNWCASRETQCPMVAGLTVKVNGIVVKHYKPSELNSCPVLEKLNHDTNRTSRKCSECNKSFKGTGRSKYCGDVCKKIAKYRSNRKSYYTNSGK